jgi:hypothetical protein
LEASISWMISVSFFFMKRTSIMDARFASP